MKDYYKILNIDKSATKEDIKKSYRKLSKKYHPDVNPNGEKMFKDITEAYEVLSNDNKRREYDNPKDTFSDFFQQFTGGRRTTTVPSKKLILKVSVEDIYFSKNKDVTYQVSNSCNTCGGNGGDVSQCRNCGGSGYIQKTFGSGFFRQTTTQTCGHCNGTGNKVINPCYDCGGKGTKFKFENVSIKVPKDVDEGTRVKIRGKGDFYNNIGRGDLEVIFNITKENGFTKINNDIVYDKILNITDLMINDGIIIPHPDGDMKVRIPLNYKSDKPLRIKGKGFKNRTVGDLYINIFFEYKEISNDERDLILEHINKSSYQDI